MKKTGVLYWRQKQQQRCSKKLGVLKKFPKIHSTTPVPEPLFSIKLQVEAHEFCKISKNTFFAEHLWVTASVEFIKKMSHLLLFKS